MYMDVRLPLPINSNPGMVLPPRKFTTVHDVARFAAQLIDGIMEYKEIIDRCVVYFFGFKWRLTTATEFGSFQKFSVTFQEFPVNSKKLLICERTQVQIRTSPNILFR